MNGEIEKVGDEIEVDDDVEENVAPEDTVVITEDLADIGDGGETTAELNVEKLVAKIDKDDDGHKKEVHRRLEELEDKKREEQELDSTYNFNLDDEL